MTRKHLIPILCLLAALLIAPAAAADTTVPISEQNTTLPIPDVPKIQIKYYDYSAQIAQILNTADNPTKKLSKMTEAIGYTDNLHAWMHSEVDHETGERTYQKGLLAALLGLFGIGNDEPYATEAEAEAAQAEYYANFILNYKPSGGFGEPIA